MEIRGRQGEVGAFLNGAAFESLACNLCGRDEFFLLAERDALGLPVRTVMCAACGLMAINPRLTKPWYERYYAYVDGLRRAYKHGIENPKEKLGRGFEEARRHGRALAAGLGSFLKPGLTIDVGSAEGGLLAGMREVLPIEPVGIEPTIARAEFATSRGITTYAALIENIADVAPKLPAAANIVCTKSLNHFLDPGYFFRWAYATLAPDGRLLLEVKNFRQQARMSGRIHFGIQIDHPFMFVPETLASFVRAAGFEILAFEVDEEKRRKARLAQKRAGLPVGHIRLIARKTERPSFAAPLPAQPRLVRRLRWEFSALGLFTHYLFRYAMPVRNTLRRMGISP